MSDLAISVRDLSKSYGETKAVSHINFDVPLGTVCGFVGPNGSGKTTTIRALLGLVTPTTGSGTILGSPISQPEKYLPRVGAMIEGPAFYPALSGADNLHLLATLGGFPHQRVDELIERVGLAGRGGSKYKTYSLGMKQRLGIAAALLPNPQLLILDEPANGLDPEGIQEIRALLRSLADNGTTVFVSSHLLSEIEIISDHLVILRRGELVFAGELEELLNNQRPTLLVKPEWEGDLQKLLDLARQQGFGASILGGVLHIQANADRAADFNRAAHEAGVTLAQLTPQLPNLEETFFEMTGGGG